jgi:hypothetical protein
MDKAISAPLRGIKLKVMKKLLTLLIVMLGAISMANARDYVTTDVAQLPAAAQKILKTHFPKTGVNHIKIDSNIIGSKDYDVILDNGTELDFDNSGNLKEIDCGHNAVPAALVLKPIRDYVANNFKGRKIVGLEINSRSYDVELSDGLDLKFDRSGNFLKIDD